MTIADDTQRSSSGRDAVNDSLADPYVGTILNDRYRVERKLGKGGHGNVYEGVQIGSGRKVGIKMLRPEAIDDPELEGRFRHEGLVLCSLKSAHTVVTYDVAQTDDDTMYIVMELLEGQTLQQLIAEQAPLDWRRVLDIVRQTCSALTEAHAVGIVHRDLKPANIHVEQRHGDREFVKVLDFGIAKILHGEPLGMSTVPKLTARGQTVGTLRYMSPEQLLGTKLDGRSDIYSLGVLTYELLTQDVPFPKATKPAQLIASQLRKNPSPPSEVHPEGNIPASVDRMMLNMLAKGAEERFESAAALAAECERILAMSPTEVMAESTQSSSEQPSPSKADLPFADTMAVDITAPASIDGDVLTAPSHEGEPTTLMMTADKRGSTQLIPKHERSRRAILLWTLIALSIGLAVAIALVAR